MGWTSYATWFGYFPLLALSCSTFPRCLAWHLHLSYSTRRYVETVDSYLLILSDTVTPSGRLAGSRISCWGFINAGRGTDGGPLGKQVPPLCTNTAEKQMKQVCRIFLQTCEKDLKMDHLSDDRGARAAILNP